MYLTPITLGPPTHLYRTYYIIGTFQPVQPFISYGEIGISDTEVDAKGLGLKPFAEEVDHQVQDLKMYEGGALVFNLERVEEFVVLQVRIRWVRCRV